MGKKDKRERDGEDDTDRNRKDKKRMQKEAEKVAETLGYSNEINPFGDSNLLKPFVWGKKLEKERKQGNSSVTAEEKRLQQMMEIERLRKRREDKEREAEELERVRAEELRLRESMQYGDWQRKEEEFHTTQTQVRSTLRLLERREQPIDLIAKNVLLLESASSTERDDHVVALRLSSLRESPLQDPLAILSELRSEELDALLEDVNSYIELAEMKSSAYVSFWRLVHEATVAERRRRSHRRSDKALHKSVVSEVQRLLEGKSAAELWAMAEDIEASIRAGEKVDVEYWERVVAEVRAQRARLLLREEHASMCLRREEVLGRLQALREELAVAATLAAPQREDVKLMYSSSAAMQSEASTSALTAAELAFLRAEEEQGLTASEHTMGLRDEHPVARTYPWAQQFTPRKPQYYNRVTMGFDHNKYNQTHYDKDNPPPKLVQGYKFNIFYGDLVDTSRTPRYSLEGADEQEAAIIRFHAGAPYTDLAFKIVNQEWDRDKRNFKCVFEQGVMQLHFNFKRHWYRR